MPVSDTPRSNMPISIRSAAPHDVPTILAIEQAAPAASHWTAEQYQSRVQSSNKSSRTSSDKGPARTSAQRPVQSTCFLVAECAGQVCGFICARIVAGEWEIENVVVAEKFRRDGIAAKLMRSLIAQWEESAGTAVLLEVRESNAAARALYAKCGFHETGRRRGYYREPVEDAILYARNR